MTLDGGRQILLVEDNPGDAHFIRDLLEAAGPRDRVMHVDTLAGAIGRLGGPTVDAVLLDLRLPDGMGVECVKAVTASAEDVPIVVLTGIDDHDMALACLAAGAQDYLSKQDVRSRTLQRALGYAIARVREGAERRRADVLQRRLAAIVEASSDAIISTDVDGIVTSWNRGAERIFGYSRNEAMGRDLSEVVRPIDTADAFEQARRLARSRIDIAAAEAQEVIRLRKDGRSVSLSVVACTLCDAAGKVTAMAAICRDVTEQRELETQLALADRMVSIGTLAAGVAHEINNPLASLIGNLDLAVEGARSLGANATLPPDLMDELQDAREASDRIRHIVRDIGLFSRVEDDDLGPIDVHRVIESTVRLAASAIRERARLVWDLGTVPLVDANEGGLGQVVLNLLVNATHAIPLGDPDGNEIRIATRGDGSGQVRIAVSDTGSGIPVAVQSRLFTAFFTTKPVGQGTGLGLAISRRIVASFGGEISFETEVGRGTTFIVTLPASSAIVSDPAAVGVPTAVANVRARLLVVDDEAMVRQTLRRALGAQHDVTDAASADAALAMLERDTAFDLILCDLIMPQITGMEFYARVRERHPGLESRIVFMTGAAATSTARAFLDAVDNHCIEKPFDLQALRSLTNELAKARA